MNTESIELLNWARGTGFQIATAVFVFGLIYRVVTILILGRKQNISKARGSAVAAGATTVITRFAPVAGMFSINPILHIAGFVFHAGFFVVLFFYAPHIEVIGGLIGFSWPALSTGVITAIAMLTMIALIVLLAYRLTDPVRRYISDRQDYLIWIISFLPLITGYLAFQHMLLPYTLMLACHLLSVELLMVLLPFSRLSHFVTVFFARFYGGAESGRKGVLS
jgi:nitrate reductase gamma subunit